MSSLNPKPRAALLPLGWPHDADDREAFTRVLLAAGADVERMLDPAAGSTDSFIRHTLRMPFLRSGRDTPLVAFAPAEAEVDSILEMRHRLIDSIPKLRSATWLVYVALAIRSTFPKVAQRYGGLFDAGGGLTIWHVHFGAVALVGADTWLAGLNQRLDELLEPNPESGIVPVEPEFVTTFATNHVPTTEPAPPVDALQFDDAPAYAAVAIRSLSPRSNAFSSDERLPSSLPPNPRLRRR